MFPHNSTNHGLESEKVMKQSLFFGTSLDFPKRYEILKCAKILNLREKDHGEAINHQIRQSKVGRPDMDIARFIPTLFIVEECFTIATISSHL